MHQAPGTAQEANSSDGDAYVPILTRISITMQVAAVCYTAFVPAANVAVDFAGYAEAGGLRVDEFAKMSQPLRRLYTHMI